jgi:hypothetical protein
MLSSIVIVIVALGELHNPLTSRQAQAPDLKAF